ncbi:GNAT family N-acetyltransferase [Chromobacterium fluminis]|uniref:GNAT family N-acetyltransferase n=1 Tax=Chromobacterium fluminis TaxID=3044269 RepID=UPI003F7430C5
MALEDLSPAPTLPVRHGNGLLLRAAVAEEMDAVYLMGRDVWGEGCSEAEYLRICRDSHKYRRGSWHVLADTDGGLLCSAIAYRLPSLAEREAVGIGSIATAPARRGQGFASLFLKEVLSAYREQCLAEVFLLYADIHREFYRRFGFRVLPEALQARGDALGMVLCAPELWEDAMLALAERPLGYF